MSGQIALIVVVLVLTAVLQTFTGFGFAVLSAPVKMDNHEHISTTNAALGRRPSWRRACTAQPRN